MMAVAIPEEVKPCHKFYQPYGIAEQLLYCKAPVVFLSGPAGTGKSRACLEKLHLCAEKYAGMRGLMVRKTRESLTESGLVTFEEKVVPVGHPILDGPQRRMRQAYHYPNGSEIVVGGMDKASKVMSTEYDMVYVQEGIELTVDDLESLDTRCRNGVMPYQQIIGDTNPDTPIHWLKQKANDGSLLMLESRHEDNPVLYDNETGEWTERGKAYIARLDALTGPRKLRLRNGLWVQAEGVVYEGFDPALHLVERFEIPADWPRYWAVDFGYVNPFVFQAWAEDPDGRLYRYREIYHTGRLVEEHAKRIKEITKDEPRPRAVICDHDAEGRATLEDKLGISTRPAKKAVTEGIQAVASRLKIADDGKPRVFFLRDSVDERDPVLVEKVSPTCTEEEFPSYVWDVSNGRKRGEEPVKAYDHGMDTTRYLVNHFELKSSFAMV